MLGSIFSEFDKDKITGSTSARDSPGSSLSSHSLLVVLPGSEIDPRSEFISLKRAFLRELMIQR